MKLLLVFTLIFSVSEGKLEFDDVMCDEELKKLDLAMENHELWAWKRS